MPILNDIIDWVETKPVFWQVAIDRLVRNNKLSDADISELIEICKADFGLSELEFDRVNFESLRAFIGKATNNNNITLSKIFNIGNLSALSKTSELEFAPRGLTLVYGDNGSGKSSYVSILKHVCNTRGHKPSLNGNLYDPDCFGNDKKADIEYVLEGTRRNIVSLINTEVNDAALKSVDVFDTSSANHYIEGEDEIAFIPQGLSILEKFASGLKSIEDEFHKERSGLSLQKFDHALLEVSEGSTAKSFLNNLNSETTLDELRAESGWDLNKTAKMQVLRKEIEKLNGSDPKKIARENKEKISRFKILKSKFQALEDALSSQALADIKSALNTYVSTGLALNESSKKTFAKLPIQGIGNDSWKLLWESARKFYNESTTTGDFPNTQDDTNCPLCLQELGHEAKKRFTDFEAFVQNDIQKKYDEALEKYALAIENLERLDFSLEELEPITHELEELIPGYSQNQKDYIDAFVKQRDYLLGLLNSKRRTETINSFEIVSAPKKMIAELIDHLTGTNKKLETATIEEEIQALGKALNQLKGEKKLYDYKPKLAREIYRQKKIKLLNQCLSKCNTRAITTLSNALTTKYITQSLKQNFKTELNRFGFRNIKIETETKGERGKQYHFLRLDEQNSGSVALKDVISEGEHRCISLATFFSELSISEHKSAIIFDDPVSSLDHKWRHKIAKRIVEESKDRQVIVFTHDITFLLMIQEHSEAFQYPLNITSLTRKKKETGLIARNPPWDALSVGRRIGLLKNEYQKLEKIERTETEEVYNEKVKPLYGKLRETWERFVEEVFLNGAVQRFGRSIQAQRLSKVVDLTVDDYNLVESNMSKCSTYFTGHDTAGMLIEEMPDSSEFLTDLKVLEDFTMKIRKRRKK